MLPPHLPILVISLMPCHKLDPSSYLHHVERVSGLVESAVDMQVSSSISTDDAAEIMR